MPGVPSGKGCDACRKQKKKCDQAKPTCSRCTRLSIPCVGGGQQRYKFKVQVLEEGGSSATSSSKSKSKFPSTPPPKTDAISTKAGASPLALIPASRTTAIAGVFVSRLEVTDARYDLTCYGSFLRHLPQRLGVNKALDASVDAFSTAFSQFYTVDKSVVAYSKYGQALKAVRDCLNDPSQAKTIETMCAIYLVMVVQGWIDPTEDQTATHAEGLAYLLEAASYRNWSGAGEFETEMIITTCVPVIIEGMVNPRIKLQPWLFKLLDKFAPPGRFGPKPPDYDKKERENPDSLPSLTLRALSRMGDYLRDPVSHHLDILSAYHMLRLDCGKLHTKTKNLFPVDKSSPHATYFLRSNRGIQVAYTMAISLALIINSILQSFDPLDDSLAKESASCITELMRMAENGLSSRPLGARHIPIGLSIAWAVTNDPVMKHSLAAMILEYQLDSGNTNWVKIASWWEAKFKSMSFQILAHQGRVPADFDWNGEVEEVTSSDCSMQ
ncbi:hypothetical protein B0J13DRAFT_532022 [Dactylonectria estremocensis]|uniref:Zn(2)-C6 fungal-type domain-containing protein n=1 Tax=Dactylonectria estremocensis TaxID=1079267 RepID=A0A9P9IJN1_9HYPO|nr:hypothetical protein B0J13DRAFT_532022 [Dactylonectria estremocensis]